jgi:hypothetical protein
MIRRLSVVAVASLAVGLGPVAAAQAATAPARTAHPAAASTLPNPCHTVTRTSVRTLMRTGAHARLTERQRRFTKPIVYRQCVIRHARQKLVVQVQHRAGGLGGPFNCYQRPRLGSKGQVCVSASKSLHFSFVVFRKHGIYVSDGLNATLPHHGRRLVTFAVAQYRHFTG